MDWKDLLKRTDLVGGEIQVFLRGDGIYRSPIKAIEMSGETIHFKSEKTAKETSLDGKVEWVPCRNKNHYFEMKERLLGSPAGRVQFDTHGSGRSRAPPFG